MSSSFWMEYGILLFAAFLGSIAILPYSLRLLKESKKKKPNKMPFWILILLSLIQNLILFGIVTYIGLLTAHQLGIEPLVIQALSIGAGSTEILHLLLPALLIGLLAGAFLLFADLLFVPYFPEKLLQTALKTTQWENFTASFYGGINEELLMRLFGVSVIVWVLSKVWHMNTSAPTPGVFWTAIIVMSLLFAIGHLPALKQLLGKITNPMLLRTILLNTPIGLLCGWIYWRYGIEAAIVSHFTADIVYHIGGTFVLRRIHSK